MDGLGVTQEWTNAQDKQPLTVSLKKEIITFLLNSSHGCLLLQTQCYMQFQRFFETQNQGRVDLAMGAGLLPGQRSACSGKKASPVTMWSLLAEESKFQLLSYVSEF